MMKIDRVELQHSVPCAWIVVPAVQCSCYFEPVSVVSTGKDGEC